MPAAVVRLHRKFAKQDSFASLADGSGGWNDFPAPRKVGLGSRRKVKPASVHLLAPTGRAVGSDRDGCRLAPSRTGSIGRPLTRAAGPSSLRSACGSAYRLGRLGTSPAFVAAKRDVAMGVRSACDPSKQQSSEISAQLRARRRTAAIPISAAPNSGRLAGSGT